MTEPIMDIATAAPGMLDFWWVFLALIATIFVTGRYLDRLEERAEE